MAFGNMGETSGTGVAFTRDPATGEKHLMGEFLMNAQGEDVLQVFVHHRRLTSKRSYAGSTNSS